MAQRQRIGGPSLGSQVWLKQQFDQLHHEHAAILKKIDGLQTVISPELEQQIRKAAKLSATIDEKVPDKQMPPNKS